MRWQYPKIGIFSDTLTRKTREESDPILTSLRQELEPAFVKADLQLHVAILAPKSWRKLGCDNNIYSAYSKMFYFETPLPAHHLIISRIYVRYYKVRCLPEGLWSLVAAPASVWWRPEDLWPPCCQFYLKSMRLFITDLQLFPDVFFLNLEQTVEELKVLSFQLVLPHLAVWLAQVTPSKTSGLVCFWPHSIKKKATHTQTHTYTRLHAGFWVYAFLHCTKRADFPTLPLVVYCSVLLPLQHVYWSVFPCIYNQPLATSNLRRFGSPRNVCDINGLNFGLEETAFIHVITHRFMTLCCQSGSELRVYSWVDLNARLRPEAAPSACELSFLLNGWYVHGVADKQYEICSCVFPHSGEEKSPKLFTWVLNSCKIHLQADYHTHLSASNPDFPSRLQINWNFYRFETLYLWLLTAFDVVERCFCKWLGVSGGVDLSWICLVFCMSEGRSVHVYVPLAGFRWAVCTCGEVTLAGMYACLL